MSIPRIAANLAVVLLCFPHFMTAQTGGSSTLIDACEDTLAWKTFQSAGVVVSQHSDSGYSGKALRYDIQFEKGSGYGGIIRNCDLQLPEDYELTFVLRATVPINNLEFKVSNDSAGEDIWWVNTRDYHYPSAWKRIIIKKRHLSFAWGPHSAPKPDRLRRIEIVTTAGTGGSGSVWIDDLRLVAIPPPPAILPEPSVSVSSTRGTRSSASCVLSGSRGGWTSKTATNEWMTIAYGYRKEFGAVRLRWDKNLSGLQYTILSSTDGVSYDTLHAVRDGCGGDVTIYTPESEASFVKLLLHSNRSGRPFHLLNLQLLSSDSVSTENDYVSAIAKHSPEGWYPRYFLNKASYWTIVGVASDEKEALIDVDGTIEVDKQQFSLEPLVRLQSGTLLTWSNADCRQSLENNYLPIPTVERNYRGLKVLVTPLARGTPGRSTLMVRYIVRNVSTRNQKGVFSVAIRPFQVNPTYQWLNTQGGFARTERMSINENTAVVGTKTVTVSGQPGQTGVTCADRGDIIQYIAAGQLPVATAIVDPWGMASGAFSYSFSLPPGDSMLVIASVPFWKADSMDPVTVGPQEFENALDASRSDWTKKLGTVQFHLPPDAKKLLDVVRSNLAYLLINKDGPGFQPGSRSYERSWIRDGAMSSAALLRFGMNDDVRRFIEWYSQYQFENGMVPCVVDGRGPDPVPENDSHGEFIYSCMEYFRFTHDSTFLRKEWPHIEAAVGYIQALRSQRMTKEYELDKRAFYGLLPESISHEGYSAKPMHSYWDDFFALKGLRDAAAAASILGERLKGGQYDSIASAFQIDFRNSILASMRTHNIDFIPGCVELGDFDPTSTSIAVFPCDASAWLPRAALDATFAKYYHWFIQRQNDEIAWDAFTPYELRTVTTFVRLGQKDKAHRLIDWFLKFQRPSAWNGWAEVVWHNPDEAKFIGDMPHSWVGSDFINAFRSLFAFERDDKASLVIGAGLKDDWVRHGFSVSGMPTHFGTLSYAVKVSGTSDVVLDISGSVNASLSPILVPVTLLSRSLQSASVNGKNVPPAHGYVRVTSLPASVVFHY